MFDVTKPGSTQPASMPTCTSAKSGQREHQQTPAAGNGNYLQTVLNSADITPQPSKAALYCPRSPTPSTSPPSDNNLERLREVEEIIKDLDTECMENWIQKVVDNHVE